MIQRHDVDLDPIAAGTANSHPSSLVAEPLTSICEWRGEPAVSASGAVHRGQGQSRPRSPWLAAARERGLSPVATSPWARAEGTRQCPPDAGYWYSRVIESCVFPGGHPRAPAKS